MTDILSAYPQLYIGQYTQTVFALDSDQFPNTYQHQILTPRTESISMVLYPVNQIKKHLSFFHCYKLSSSWSCLFPFFLLKRSKKFKNFFHKSAICRRPFCAIALEQSPEKREEEKSKTQEADFDVVGRWVLIPTANIRGSKY